MEVAQQSFNKVNVNRALHKLVERAANAGELLVKGTIDEEDYLSIKSDCENRIDILGEQLNDAYRLEVQQKQTLKKLTDYFLNSALLFKGTSQSIRLKAAALFLKDDLVYIGADIFYYLKPEVQVIADCVQTCWAIAKKPRM